MSLPPIFYHCFRPPLPYLRTLALQEKLHEIQLLRRKTSSHNDLLLLLQHRPVFTAGRRQTELSVQTDRTRLTRIGADFVTTARGGQLTYHGPGQIVGYPLLDLARGSTVMGIREYICRLQKTLEEYLHAAHGLAHVQSEHTGVFLDAATKVGSIGVQVRHRLTTHGFALNVTREPLPWFDLVVACGLTDVKAGCVEVAAGKVVDVGDEMGALVGSFGRVFEREMVRLDTGDGGAVSEAILELEKEADGMGDWHRKPNSLTQF
jgi:lipoyl(octanoyl) transferase 2